MPLVSLTAPRLPRHLVVRLPNGEHRAVPRAATDLPTTAAAEKSQRSALRVTVRTLLPLVALARSLLERQEEFADDRTASQLDGSSPGASVASHEYEQWRHQPGLTLSTADREALRVVGENFPILWRAPTTTVVDRKRLLRLVIREVLLDNHRARGQVWLQINWQTGATTEHWLRRCVLSYTQHADLEDVEQQVRSLHTAGRVDGEIAAALNSAGFRTAHGRAFNGRAVWYLRQAWGLPAVATTTSLEPAESEQVISAEEAAGIIGVWPTTIYKWLRIGRLRGLQVRSGLPWKVVVSPAVIAALQVHVAQARRVIRRPPIT